MSWKKVVKNQDMRYISEKDEVCEIQVCHATTCIQNLDKACTLPVVSIRADGSCAQYDEATKEPEPHTRGQQSFIDRARRTLESQKDAMNK